MCSSDLERPHAKQRIGPERSTGRTQGDVVDGIEHRDLAAEELALGFEQVDGLLDDIAQAGALALGKITDGIMDVLRGITVTGEDRLDKAPFFFHPYH